MHKNASEVQLDLKADIDIGSIDSWGPPESEPSIGNLVQARPLSMSELLILHALLEATSLLPEESLPGGEVSAFEESVLENAFDSSQGLDDVCPVVVEIP